MGVGTVATSADGDRFGHPLEDEQPHNDEEEIDPLEAIWAKVSYYT